MKLCVWLTLLALGVGAVLAAKDKCKCGKKKTDACLAKVQTFLDALMDEFEEEEEEGEVADGQPQEGEEEADPWSPEEYLNSECITACRAESFGDNSDAAYSCELEFHNQLHDTFGEVKSCVNEQTVCDVQLGKDLDFEAMMALKHILKKKKKGKRHGKDEEEMMDAFLEMLPEDVRGYVGCAMECGAEEFGEGGWEEDGYGSHGDGSHGDGDMFGMDQAEWDGLSKKEQRKHKKEHKKAARQAKKEERALMRCGKKMGPCFAETYAVCVPAEEEVRSFLSTHCDCMNQAVGSSVDCETLVPMFVQHIMAEMDL